jgi:hypothetical protein
MSRSLVHLHRAVLTVGCAVRPKSPPTRTWAQPCDDCVPGVPNFAMVTDKLWRGSQPDVNDPDIFRKLEQRGVKTVINLRHDHDDFPKLSQTNMRYLWIPMRPCIRRKRIWSFSSAHYGGLSLTQTNGPSSYTALKVKTERGSVSQPIGSSKKSGTQAMPSTRCPISVTTRSGLAIQLSCVACRKKESSSGQSKQSAVRTWIPRGLLPSNLL